MPLDDTNPPEEAAWGAVGAQGTHFQARRHPDGSAQFVTFSDKDKESKTYALHIPPDAVMSLLDFLINRPAGALN